MELKEFTQKVLELFEIENIEELPNKLINTLKLETKEKDEKLKAYTKLATNDEDIDYLQRLYQHWLSNREELSQDFTPKSMSRLVARLSETDNEKVIYDMCSGSGSLTLQKHEFKPDCKYVLHELDTNVIPFLLFNLALHNVEAHVINGDVLSGEMIKEYHLRKGKIYSSLFNELPCTGFKYDTVISNPPFNLKSDNDLLVNKVKVKKNNMNFAFVLKSLENLSDKGKAVFILPNGIMTSGNEKEYRKYLISKDLIETVIYCPGNLFESTDIPTCILVLNKNKKNPKKITLINSAPTTIIERKQKGELHTKNRTYKKKLLAYNDGDIEEILEAINDVTATVPDVYTTVDTTQIIEEDYVLSPGRYIPCKPDKDESRSFKDILHDLKDTQKERSKLKLTMNEGLAKTIGLDEIFENEKEGEKTLKEIEHNLQELKRTNPDKIDVPDKDLKLHNERFLTLSKNKNEFKFENKSKTDISEILFVVVQMWSANVMLWNNKENIYLAELRDKLLPLLMSGELDVSECDIAE